MDDAKIRSFLVMFIIKLNLFGIRERIFSMLLDAWLNCEKD